MMVIYEQIVCVISRITKVKFCISETFILYQFLLIMNHNVPLCMILWTWQCRQNPRTWKSRCSSGSAGNASWHFRRWRESVWMRWQALENFWLSLCLMRKILRKWKSLGETALICSCVCVVIFVACCDWWRYIFLCWDIDVQCILIGISLAKKFLIVFARRSRIYKHSQSIDSARWLIFNPFVCIELL